MHFATCSLIMPYPSPSPVPPAPQSCSSDNPEQIARVALIHQGITPHQQMQDALLLGPNTQTYEWYAVYFQCVTFTTSWLPVCGLLLIVPIPAIQYFFSFCFILTFLHTSFLLLSAIQYVVLLLCLFLNTFILLYLVLLFLLQHVTPEKC